MGYQLEDLEDPGGRLQVARVEEDGGGGGDRGGGPRHGDVVGHSSQVPAILLVELIKGQGRDH